MDGRRRDRADGPDTMSGRAGWSLPGRTERENRPGPSGLPEWKSQTELAGRRNRTGRTERGRRPWRAIGAIIGLWMLLVCPYRAAAQYYTWGADRAGLRWNTLRNGDVRVIYPDTAETVARRTLYCIEQIKPWISCGFTQPAMQIPFVIHPENFRSNGLVMWLPKRIEFLTSPAVDGYSMPWYKQLAAHEYRHAVQYNNTNRGLIRVLSYALGQQGSTVGLLCLPIWMMEGDAVISETEMSSFGRGLQPSFTLEYRAMGNIARQRRNPDKWFCGSYRDFVPNHYQLGYQITSYAWTRYDENIWNRVAWYSSRNPYLFFTTALSLKKYYKTNVRRLFRETFDDLNAYWQELPEVEDSTQPIVALPRRNYTTYTYPQPLPDGTELWVKSDFRRPTRMVILDRKSGREEQRAWTGDLSTRPAADPVTGRIWWTEYSRSPLFEQRVDSRLWYLDPGKRRPRSVRGMRNVLYPTPMEGSLAWVEYAPEGRYTVVVGRDGKAEKRYPMPLLTEIHSLAWDNATRALYYIATDDSGMWIGTFDAGGAPRPITSGAYITLSNLRARDGWLYYGSIASGRDEVHGYDLREGREWQLTRSTYGSFAGVAADDGALLASTYTARGYCPSVGDTALRLAVAPSKLPRNVVNPPRKRWNAINLDTVHFTADDSLGSLKRHPARRFRKVPHLVNIHSWMPVAFNPFEAVDEHRVSLNWGATLISQNLLSSAEAFFSYGYNRAEGSLLRLGVRYFGLGVRLDLDGTWGGNQQIYALSQRNPETGKPEYQRHPAPDKYYSLGLRASLPLVFERGFHTRSLTVSTGWQWSNGLVADLGRIRYDPESHTITNIEHIGYNTGLHKLDFRIGFADHERMAYRDILPRWGYAASLTYALNPSNHDFSDLISAYVRVYAPGLARPHGISVAAAFQTSIGGFKTPDGRRLLTYNAAAIIPAGFDSPDIGNNGYFALSARYHLPLCYPEGGIPSVVYIKRIRAAIGMDYARFKRFYAVYRDHGAAIYSHTRRLRSYGGTLSLDLNVFRQPSSATSSIDIGLFKPVPSRGLYVSVGVGLPF